MRALQQRSRGSGNAKLAAKSLDTAAAATTATAVVLEWV